MRKLEELYNFRVKKEQLELYENEFNYLLWQECISKDLFSFWKSISK